MKINSGTKFWGLFLVKIGGFSLIVVILVSSLINSTPIPSRGIDPSIDQDLVKYIVVFMLYSFMAIVLLVLIYWDLTDILKKNSKRSSKRSSRRR